MVVCLVLKHCWWTPCSRAMQAQAGPARVFLSVWWMHRHGKSLRATSLTAHEVSCCSPRPAVLESHFLLHTQLFVEYPTIRFFFSNNNPCCNIFFPLILFFLTMLFNVHKLQADYYTGKASLEVQQDLHQPNSGGKSLSALTKKQGRQGWQDNVSIFSHFLGLISCDNSLLHWIPLLPRLCCPDFLCTASSTAWSTPKVAVALQVCHMFPQGHAPQRTKIPRLLIMFVWLHISFRETITCRGVRQHQLEYFIYFSWDSKAKGAACHMQRVCCTTG